jgi:hypothetical protein
MDLLRSVGLWLLSCIAVMGQPRPSLLCDHVSDKVVAMGPMPVTTMVICTSKKQE